MTIKSLTHKEKSSILIANLMQTALLKAELLSYAYDNGLETIKLALEDSFKDERMVELAICYIEGTLKYLKEEE